MRCVYSGYERHTSGLHWGVLHTNLPFFLYHLCQIAAPRLTLPRRITQSPHTSIPPPPGGRKGMVCKETVDGLGVSQIFAQDLKQQVVICCREMHDVCTQLSASCGGKCQDKMRKAWSKIKTKRKNNHSLSNMQWHRFTSFQPLTTWSETVMLNFESSSHCHFKGLVRVTLVQLTLNSVKRISGLSPIPDWKMKIVKTQLMWMDCVPQWGNRALDIHHCAVKDILFCRAVVKDGCAHFCQVWTCVTAILSQCRQSVSLAEVLCLLPRLKQDFCAALCMELLHFLFPLLIEKRTVLSCTLDEL